MRELLSKARARVIRHLVLDKGALALAIGMGGLILLLLIGTEVLDWYWPVLLAALSLGVGIYQLRKHIPSRYHLAQRIDHRMSLSDSLSTAVYFSEHPQPGREAICAAQYRFAEGLAGSVNLEQALPMARSRYLLPALGLLAVASGLFVARYVWIGSLDLHASLLEMAVDTFFTSPAEVAAAKAAKSGFHPRPFDPTQPNAPPEDVQPAIPPDAEKGKQLVDSQQNEDSGEKSADEGEKSDSQDAKDGDSPQDKSQKQDKASDREGDDKGQNDSQGQDKRSLMDRIRDVAQNLMNKVSSNEAKQQNAKNNKEKGQKSDKGGKGDDDANQDQSSEADAQPNSDDAGGKGKPSPKQAESKGPDADKGASGNGSNDGKKSVEEAKAEEAMGKVSEFLTVRSSAISGDMMVEVGETKQQLKTAMTQQKAGHSDSGGEIHRDQVPLADQTFVERYFQEIRKPAGASKAKSSEAKAPGKNDAKAKSN